MGTIIMILLIAAIIAEVGLGTIIFWIICGAAIFFGIVWKIVSWLEKRGYITYGRYYTYYLKPDCSSRNTKQHNHSSWQHQDSDSGQSFLPDTPTSQNEDGDWRTTYMDDTSYDDREYDQRHDDDRFDNGGW